MWLNRPHEVTALLIDGANLYETCKMAGYFTDYATVLRHFKPQQALYFTALPKSDRVNDPNGLFKMIDYIVYNGYNLITKEVKTYINDGIETLKGNMDVEIAVHILKAARWCNHIVLFTGDGDFRLAVEDVQAQGVRVTVVSALRTNPPMIADELRRQANTFIDLCDPKIKEEWKWDRPRR